MSSYGLSWQSSFGIIVLLYFYSHYLFASGAAHIGAMYTAFLSVAIACGTPGLLAAVALGQVQHDQHELLKYLSSADLLCKLILGNPLIIWASASSLCMPASKCAERGP